MADKSLVASDGHVARVSGLYARQKLLFLESYLSAALQATRRKRTRHFIDVFAGPGLNSLADGSQEFVGSPIVAAQARAHSGGYGFHTIDAFNVDPASHLALSARFAARANCVAANARHSDGLAGAQSILRKLDQHSYAVLGLDIESPGQLPWSALVDLRNAAPESTDAYILLPVAMGLLRQVSYVEKFWEENATSLNTFFGDESWRDALQHRASDAHHARQRTKEALTNAYLTRLCTLWPRTRLVARVNKKGRQNLYYMVLATGSPAGANLAEWAAGKAAPRSPQLPLI